MSKAKIWGCIWILVLLLVTTSCEPYNGTYTFFRQDRSNVDKVEICSYDSYTRTRDVIAELSKEDGEELLTAISSLECREYCPGDHPREYGPIMVCITYYDGEIEMIGFTNIGFISPNGVRGMIPYFIGNCRELYDLICDYVDPELLPDLSEEYPSWFS